MANELSIKVMGDASNAAAAFNGLKGDADSSLGSVETASAGLKSAIDSDSASAGQSLSGLGQDFKSLESDANSAISGIKDKMGGLDLKSLGGAVGGAALFSSFEEATVSAGTLQAQLGLTKEEAQQFDSVAKEVYGNNFGSSMGDASQTVGQLHQALGLTGDELRNATEDVYRISDAFGQQGADAQILTENVRTMKAAFPGKSEAEILDIIADGFQSGAGTAGDFQDTLIEYPRYFADIGLGAEDMSNFIKSGMDAGARNTDILGDAVKEMGILMKDESSEAGEALTGMFGASEAEELRKNFAAGGEAGRTAFFDILEGLNQIEDPLERNKVAVQLFGTVGEDLAGSLGDMLPAFLATRDATNEVGDATASLDAQYAGTTGKMEGFKRQIEMSLIGPLGSVAGPALEAGGALSGIGATMLGLQGLGVNVTGGFGKMAGALTAVANPMRLVTAAQAGLNLVMSANPIALIVLGLVALGVGLVLAYQHSETFRDIVNGAFSAVKGVAMGVVDYFTGSVVPFFTTTLPGAFSSLRETIGGVFNGVLETVTGVFTGIQTFLQPAVDAISLIITNWTNNLKVIWDAFWPPFKTVIDTVWGGIKLAIETYVGGLNLVFQTALGAVKLVWDTVWNGLKAVVDAIWPPIKVVVETAIGGIRAVVETVLGAVKTVWETVWGALRPFIEPIWNGIKSFIETTVNAVKAVIETAINGIKSTWETIWNTVRTVAETVWGGIKAAIETQLGLIVQLVTGDLSGLRDTVAGIWDAVSGKATDIWNAIRDSVSSLATAAKELVVGAITGARDSLSGLWDEVKTKAEDTWNTLRDNVTTAAETARDQVTGAITTARDTLSGLWDEVKTKAEEVWNTLRDNVTTAAEEARDQVTAAITTARDSLSGLWDEVKTKAEEVWNTLRDNVTTAAEEARDNVIDAIDDIPGDITDALSGLYGIGEDAIQGLLDGMTSIGSDALTWARGFVSDLLDVLSDVPGFSPIERATASVGKRAMLGFGDGMERNASGVLDVAQGVSQATVDLFQQAARDFLAAEGSLVSRSPVMRQAHAVYTGNDQVIMPAVPSGSPSAWAGDNGTELVFNGPVTIHARDRADAERSMGDAAYGLQNARRRRGDS